MRANNKALSPFFLFITSVFTAPKATADPAPYSQQPPPPPPLRTSGILAHSRMRKRRKRRRPWIGGVAALARKVLPRFSLPLQPSAYPQPGGRRACATPGQARPSASRVVPSVLLPEPLRCVPGFLVLSYVGLSTGEARPVPSLLRRRFCLARCLASEALLQSRKRLGARGKAKQGKGALGFGYTRHHGGTALGSAAGIGRNRERERETRWRRETN